MSLRDGPYEIIGHRGYSSRAPENTLAAVGAAIEAGANAVEWDVHVASDGTPVLFHDVHLGRTTNGVGPLRRRNLSQLKALDAGAWFSEEFAGERIPSLAEALDFTRGKLERAYCEVKGYRELEDLDRMVAIAGDLSMLECTIFISLDWGIVDRIGGQDSAARVAYILDDADRFEEALGRALENGHRMIDFDQELVSEDPFLAVRTRARGLEAAAWTVNDPATANTLADAGVTRFTTDEVEALLAWRDRLL